MKKSNLIKLFSILLIGVMALIFSTGNVLAATNFVDITNTYSSNGTNTNSTNTNSTNTNSANSNSSNTNSNRTNNTNLSNTNTGSIYNSNNLPQTGIGDSIPIVVLVAVFGISAVYAYKKISDYRNI